MGTLVAPANANSTYSLTLSQSKVQPQAGTKLSIALVGNIADVLSFYSREAGATLARELDISPVGASTSQATSDPGRAPRVWDLSWLTPIVPRLVKERADTPVTS